MKGVSVEDSEGVSLTNYPSGPTRLKLCRKISSICECVKCGHMTRIVIDKSSLACVLMNF